MAISLQWPLSSVPKVAIVEKFNCNAIKCLKLMISGYDKQTLCPLTPDREYFCLEGLNYS